MVEEAIVAFIDILGYSKIVEKHQNNIELIQKFESLIKVAKDIECYKKDPQGISYTDECRNKTIDSIKVTWASDTFIVTLQPLRNDQDEEWKMSLWIYFWYISSICQTILSQTGHVLRGGIAKGRHYENMADRSLFIFSKAYLDAYGLEKKEKENGKARIVIHDDLKKYLEGFVKGYSSCFFEDPGDKKFCLHFYPTLINDESCKKMLGNIKTGVSMNIKKNQNKEVQNKLNYFKSYHNQRVFKIFNAQLPELTI